VCLARIDHLIRVLPGRPPTSGSLERTSHSDSDVGAGSNRPHLTNRNMFRQSKNFDFAELRIIPIQKNPIGCWPTWSEAEGGQATKGTGWMPWRQEPMKDVAGCEKLRGVASRR
jgi:hypothetical protein